MATYYSSPSNQRQVTPAYLRDNVCTSYSEAQVLPSNMIQYLNQPSSAASYSGSFPGTSQLQLNPSIGTTASDSPSSQQGYHVWRGDGRNEISFMQPITDSTNMQSGSCGEDDISQNMQMRFSDYLLPGSHGNNPNAVKGEPLNNLQSPKYPKNVPNSKYLKVAQQLLDEVVNVRKALKQHEANKQQGLEGIAAKTSKEKETGMVPHGEESSTNPLQQISPVERQDLQNKITKLLSMLDEVDRRYKQYYHQMHILVSSFDVIAGNGASKPYTALALQTISRQFRCLRDAISGQIKSIRTNLGEQDTTGNNNVEGGISRLRFVDQQLRQQRALQQFGMMQQNAWRPQRGLPETSVSILRAWLFEHFLHPYPKDSDKIMLARQTGLTRGQVANWFINARVRLWKPMIEDMYKEEFGETHMESNSSSDNAPKAKDNIGASEDKVEELPQNMNSAVTEKHYPGQFQESTAADVTHDAELSRPTTMGDFFQANTHGDDNNINYQRPDMVSCTSLPHDTLVQSDGSGEGRFMDAAAAYQMAELGRFGSHDRVSLTLGLQHFDNTGLPISDAAHHNDFVSMRGVDMYNAAASSMGPNGADFNCLDQDSQRDRFGTSHLLHDFCSLR